jgi:hypothetical protein
MDEPTDRALQLQGLRRVEYDSLSREGKAVIASRSRRLTELANIGLVAELLNGFAESDDASRAYISEVIDGKHPEFDDKVRDVVRDYLDANVETSIREYYRIKYGKSGVMTASVTKTLVKESLDSEMRQVMGGTPAVRPGEDAVQAAVKDVSASTAQPTTQEGRGKAIAAMLAQIERRDVDSVMKTEFDVIGYIMSIADENKALGMTDYSVFKACESMLNDKETGVQFMREALIPANRRELLARAGGFLHNP